MSVTTEIRCLPLNATVQTAEDNADKSSYWLKVHGYAGQLRSISCLENRAWKDIFVITCQTTYL